MRLAVIAPAVTALSAVSIEDIVRALKGTGSILHLEMKLSYGRRLHGGSKARRIVWHFLATTARKRGLRFD